MTHVLSEEDIRKSVDFTEYTLCFLGCIIDKLKFYGMLGDNPSDKVNMPSTTLFVPIKSNKYRYCFDGIELIRKTLRRRGFKCELNKYDTIAGDEKGVETYKYEFKIQNIKK